jgi:hypothetical protein
VCSRFPSALLVFAVESNYCPASTVEWFHALKAIAPDAVFMGEQRTVSGARVATPGMVTTHLSKALGVEFIRSMLASDTFSISTELITERGRDASASERVRGLLCQQLEGFRAIIRRHQHADGTYEEDDDVVYSGKYDNRQDDLVMALIIAVRAASVFFSEQRYRHLMRHPFQVPFMAALGPLPDGLSAALERARQHGRVERGDYEDLSHRRF